MSLRNPTRFSRGRMSMQGIKRYFVKKEKDVGYIKELLRSKCEEYLNDYKTKKKRRIPLKFIKNKVEIETEMIKQLMVELGYEVIFDKNKCVFFVNKEIVKDL